LRPLLPALHPAGSGQCSVLSTHILYGAQNAPRLSTHYSLLTTHYSLLTAEPHEDYAVDWDVGLEVVVEHAQILLPPQVADPLLALDSQG